MERARRNRARGGGRSSGEVGFDAMVHGRKSWGWLRVPGAALSMVRRSDACLHGRSHDGDMAGGEERSGSKGAVATRRNRARELGGKEEELTAESKRGSASSGTGWRRGAVAGDLGCPRLKTRAKAALQGFRRSVARWGGRGSRGGADGLVGGARGGLWRRLRRSAARDALGHRGRG